MSTQVSEGGHDSPPFAAVQRSTAPLMSRKISCRCVQSLPRHSGWTGTRLARNYREETNVANVAIDGVVQEAQSGELLIDLINS